MSDEAQAARDAQREYDRAAQEALDKVVREAEERRKAGGS